jgi:EAL domain-containing protein (putative c-di-GMP-specific phosphodiesterase class I)/CheY-like chemotaxis protein
MSSGITTPVADGVILIVDDDPDLRRLLVLVFESAGYTTLDVASAEAALETLTTVAVRALVLDNHLPVMSGIDLVRALRSNFATVTLPVLLLTADHAMPRRLEGLWAGATDYLVKPFEPAELLARLDTHLRANAAWYQRLDRHALSEAQADRRRAELSEIITAHTFSPVFQPVVELRGLAVVGYEALTRFDDGAPPEQRFLDAASIGMGPDLELATIAAAFEAARDLDSDRFLSLNVTSDLVVHHGATLQDLIGDRDRPIVLELTEHEAVTDYEALRANLTRLEPAVEVSVDDAGAGFASLRHVIMLEPTYVKLDRSWITGIDADPTRQAMISGLSLFARQASCHLVAEGIEDELERDTLAGLDVDLGQGYLLGRPARA